MQVLRKRRLNIRKKYLFLAALLFSFVVILQISSTDSSGSLQIVLGHIVLFVSNYVVWVFLIDYIYGAIEPLTAWKENRLKASASVFLSLTTLVLLHLIVTNTIYYAYALGVTNLTLAEAMNGFKPILIRIILSRFLDVIVIIFIIKIVETYQMVQRQKMQMVSLENQLHIVQLEALRSQVNPHFLFNTLHTLNTLIGYDDSKARSMVIKVTNLLRKMLDKRDVHIIPFEEELAYFRDYLDIEQERFNDRLKVTWKISEETKPVMVPTLILQPLIENAFKHGISLIEGDGEILLSAEIKNDDLVIVLSNSIPKNEQSPHASSTKVGLSNLRNRLDQLLGTDYTFSTRQDHGLFVATMHINTKLTV